MLAAVTIADRPVAVLSRVAVERNALVLLAGLLDRRQAYSSSWEALLRPMTRRRGARILARAVAELDLVDAHAGALRQARRGESHTEPTADRHVVQRTVARQTRRLDLAARLPRARHLALEAVAGIAAEVEGRTVGDEAILNPARVGVEAVQVATLLEAAGRALAYPVTTGQAAETLIVLARYLHRRRER